jgi:hypothetical protein
VACAACYTGAPANRDVRASWVGHPRDEIVDRWGTPAATGADGAFGVLQWSHINTQITLPSGTFALSIGPGHVEGAASVRPGEIWHTTTDAAAIVDPAGAIRGVEGWALRWGPPNEENLHWGAIYGAHVGLGRLDTTPTPLPSGGAYVGGMLAPTTGLVGTFSLVSGTSDSGAAMGMAGGVALQYWPITRMWLRAGPALVLSFDPGFNNAALRPGATGGASYAFVKVGTFVVDARFDLTLDTGGGFGTLGVGVGVD